MMGLIKYAGVRSARGANWIAVIASCLHFPSFSFLTYPRFRLFWSITIFMSFILSWKQVDDLVNILAREIKNAQYKPDCLVGITVGGIIPLALLAKELDMNNVITVSASSYEGYEQGPLRISNMPQKKSLQNLRVLLVDEIAETGQTIQTVRDALLADQTLKELKTAALAINLKKCKFTPDFYALADERWIVFPWEERDFPDKFSHGSF